MTLVQVTPAPHVTDFLLTSRLSELFDRAQTRKRKYQSTWRRNYLLASNRQYSMDVQQPWSPNLTDSEIFPILSTRIAWMTDQRIAPEIAPAAEANTPFYEHMQKLGEHLQSLLRSTQIVTAWDQRVVLVLWDAALFGAGIFKSVWDSGLTTGIGNVALKRIDPWKFYPDPNATSLEDCAYMFEVNRMTMTELRRRFPGVATKVIENAITQGTTADVGLRPGPLGANNAPMAMPGNLPTSKSTVWGLPGQTNQAENIFTQGVNVYECWIKQSDSIERQATDPLNLTPEPVVYTDWRVIVYSNNVVLLDEYATNLWQYNRHPYTRYVDEETGEFWPVPITSHLAPCQIAINRLLSAMQANAELTGNPIFMDVTNSGITRTNIVNRPGLRLTLDQQAAQSQGMKPDWLKPPQMSSDIPGLISMWKQFMENISGITGVTKGQTPQGRQAQQTVQATQTSASVRIRSSLRNLERALGKSYNLLAQLVIQNYTIPRVVAIVGTDGTTQTIRLAARHFYSPTEKGAAPMKFALIVQAGSSNPTSRQARIAEADALFAMHAIDVPAVLEAHAFPNWQQVWGRLQNQLKEQEELIKAEKHKPKIERQ